MVSFQNRHSDPCEDLPKTAMQQRRQVLLGVLTEMEGLEDTEEKVLAGEDHEDPPMG